MQVQNQYLDYFIDPRFQEVYRPFTLSFEDNAVRTEHAECFPPKVEIKGYNGYNVFDHLVKNGRKRKKEKRKNEKKKMATL